ncbi:MAG TPA: hypothetical protein PLT99_12790 [Chitinophagales bacterium]|nr:hypothetical protein [Chitinophagales bacterium]
MNYFLNKNNLCNGATCNFFKVLRSKWQESILGFASKKSRLMASAKKCRVMPIHNQIRKVTYKNGDTEISSKNGGNIPLMMMFFDLITRRIFLFFVLSIAVKFPDFISILWKIFK